MSHRKSLENHLKNHLNHFLQCSLLSLHALSLYAYTYVRLRLPVKMHGTYIQNTLPRVPFTRGCRHRTFRFFMLRSILYSLDVSFALSFCSRPLVDPRAPVKPQAFFSLAREPEGGTWRRNVTTVRPFKVFYDFVLQPSRVLFPPLSP